MKPTVLLYNFTDSKRKMKVQQALMPLGFRLRAVTKEEYGLPVGVLAGVKGLNEDVLKEAGQAIEAGEETQKEESAQKQADGRLQREVPENDSSRKILVEYRRQNGAVLPGKWISQMRWRSWQAFLPPRSMHLSMHSEKRESDGLIIKQS